MASCSQKANVLGKRKPEDGLGTEPVLKKHEEESEEKEMEARETEPILKRHREEKETTKGFAVESNLISAETVETGPIQEPNKTLFVSHLPVYTKISDILCFFQNVGQVVRVRLILTNRGHPTGDSLVEFASADQANKALEEKKYDTFLTRHKLFLDVANKGAPFLPPKYCIDHKVWHQEDEAYLQQVEEDEAYLQQVEEDEDSLQQVEEDEDSLQQVEEDEDYLQQESLPIEEDETPPNAEEASVLFIANLSPQTTKISHIINFFKDVGDVVSVRLIVNHQCKHVGYAFVEFASANQANLALENKNGEYLHDHEILLMKRLKDTPLCSEAVVTVRNKTLFVTNLSSQTKISDIINFFKDVGEVVHVRLIVEHRSRLLGFGYVEFASATEAQKVMEKKNGECLNNRQIYLAFVNKPAKNIRTKYCIDHKVWYDDYPQRESLVIQEDAAVEGLDETPDFVDELSSGKKTVFAASKKKSVLGNIPFIISFFENVGEVASVRLIVDQWGKNVGCCYVEFASANEAEKAVQDKKDNGVYAKMAEIAPYPFRPKYNLTDLAEKLWYEDKLRRYGFGLPTRSNLKNLQAICCGQKITFCGQRITFPDIDS